MSFQIIFKYVYIYIYLSLIFNCENFSLPTFLSVAHASFFLYRLCLHIVLSYIPLVFFCLPGGLLPHRVPNLKRLADDPVQRQRHGMAAHHHQLVWWRPVHRVLVVVELRPVLDASCAVVVARSGTHSQDLGPVQDLHPAATPCAALPFGPASPATSSARLEISPPSPARKARTRSRCPTR